RDRPARSAEQHNRLRRLGRGGQRHRAVLDSRARADRAGRGRAGARDDAHHPAARPDPRHRPRWRCTVSGTTRTDPAVAQRRSEPTRADAAAALLAANRRRRSIRRWIAIGTLPLTLAALLFAGKLLSMY